MRTHRGATIVLNEAKVAKQREVLIDDWFTVTTRPSAANDRHKVLALTNHSTDKTGSVTYVFDEDVPVQALGSTTMSTRTNSQTGRNERVFTARVDPLQRVEFLSGPFAAFESRSSGSSVPDKAFFQRHAEEADREVRREIGVLRAALKKAQSLSGAEARWPLESIAQLCSREGIPFVDLSFVPQSSSLARDFEGNPFGGVSANPIVFQRPDGIFRATSRLRAVLPPATLFGTKAYNAASDDSHIAPSNVRQGSLGDCYFCCAAASCASIPVLIRDVFSLYQDEVQGVYRVLLCKHGWWQTVVVDDYLPTQSGRLCFARNRNQPQQLWVPLLEKAFAKVHGSFAAIRNGDAPLAMMDLTGYPYIHLKTQFAAAKAPQGADASGVAASDRLFGMLRDAFAAGGFLATAATPSKASFPDPEVFAAKAREYDLLGLTIDHVYSVLNVVEKVTTNTTNGNRITVRLVQLRDPWGGGAAASAGSAAVKSKAWNGAFSAGDSRWTRSLRSELNYSEAQEAEDEGRFWMPWDDVLRLFDNGSLCRVLRNWPQLRLQASANREGFVSHALKIMLHPRGSTSPHHDLLGDSTTGNVSFMSSASAMPKGDVLACYFGAHQKDRRAIAPTAAHQPSSSKTAAPPYLNILISVLLVDEITGEVDSVVAESDTGGTFGGYRDVFVEADLAPLSAAEAERKAYVVLVQCLTRAQKDDALDRPLVISAVMDRPSEMCQDITVLSLGHADGSKPSPSSATAPYCPRSKFNVAHYGRAADSAMWQVRLTHPARDGVKVTSKSGAIVDTRMLSPHSVVPSASPSSSTHRQTSPIRHRDPHAADTHAASYQPLHHPDFGSAGAPPAAQPLDDDATSLTMSSIMKPLEPNQCNDRCNSAVGYLNVLVLDVVLRGWSALQHKLVMYTASLVLSLSNDGRADQPNNGFATRWASLNSEVAAIDSIALDENRTTDVVPSEALATSADPNVRRTLWCEAHRFPMPGDEQSASLDGAKLYGTLKVKSADSVTGDEKTITGVLLLRDRGIERNGQGQMTSLVLREEDPLEGREIGEVHLGLSWV